MTEVAAECSRNLARLSGKERHAEIIRIAALSRAARDLSLGEAPSGPPRQHALQNTVLQYETMIKRTGNVQTGDHKKPNRQGHVNVTHLFPPA